jgi:hypothetical protein
MSYPLRSQALYASDFSLNRVVLHVVCLLRRPEKAPFFLAGIKREFSLLLQRCQAVNATGSRLTGLAQQLQ